LALIEGLTDPLRQGAAIEVLCPSLAPGGALATVTLDAVDDAIVVLVKAFF